MSGHRLDRDPVLDDAVSAAGAAGDLANLGDDSWQDGFERLRTALIDEANLNDVGVEMARAELVSYLSTRMGINAWRDEHPEVAAGTVERPIVIVGQPRTGTTILHDLLAQDPELRAPLTWEVDFPLPPPETATFTTDPRIAESQATLDMADLLIPGFTDFHPMGAQLAQECVRITGCDFRSMIFSIVYHVPSYGRWLVDEADLAPTYRWHRRYLQHLQSRHPAQQWLLKSPAHLWWLDALAAEYPDAIVVQTHRDPLKVVASVTALTAHLRRMNSDAPTIHEAADDWADDIFVGLERGMAARDAGTFPDAQIVDVHFQDMVRDPFGTIRGLYRSMGRELQPEAEARMRAFLDAHPGDGGGGGTRYRFADTGLDAGALRERARPYQERFDVVSEPLT